MPRNINSISARFKTDITFRMGRITKKYAWFGMRLKLVFVVGSKEWETSATKGFKMK